MQNDGNSSYGELSANINVSDLHGFLNLSQDERIGDDYSSLMMGSAPYDGRERPKTGVDKLRATFDKFFTVGGKSKSPNRQQQTKNSTEKNLPPLKSIPWQEQAKMLQISKPPEDKSQKATPTADRRAPKVGIQKLQEIGQALGLDPKKENILTQKYIVIATEKKAPLVRYGLDRQTLLAYGLKKESIDRLFRCLFIYSAGFYELLSTIFDHTVRKFNLVGSVWKVFWILLEYCYKADHQTILEEVQVENRDLVERLRRDLDTKNREAETFEKWQSETLQKIKQEVDNLKMEKDSVYREKMQLEEEIRINEKIYGEEVQLRIKFETKVNEVYAVAKDLKNKHQRTLEELVKLQLERDEDQKMIEGLNNQIRLLTEKNMESNHKVKLYLEKISIKDRAVEDLRQNTVNLENRLSDALVENEAINNRMLIAHNDELKLEIEALEAVNNSLKGNMEEFKLLIAGLEQDKQRLVDKLKETNLLAEKKTKEFNSMEKEILGVKYQLENAEQGEQGFAEKLEALQKEVSKYEAENSNLKNTLEAEIEKSAHINTDYVLTVERVKELTEIRIENETQMRKDKQIKEEQKREIMTRDRAIEDVGIQRDLAYKQVEELKAKVLELEATLAHIRDEQHSQQTDFETKDEHMRKAMEKEKEQKDEWFQRFKTLQKDLAKQSQQVLELQNHLQIERQTKVTLEMRINQAKELQEQNDVRNRELRAKFEELTYTLNGVKRENTALEELNQKTLTDKVNEMNNLRKEYEKKMRVIQKGMHPMYIEDLWSRAAEAQLRAKNAEYKLISTQIENEELNSQNEGLRKHLKNLSGQISKITGDYEALKEETKDSSYKKLKQVQEVDVLRKNVEMYQMQTVEIQHKYKEALQEIGLKDREMVQLEQELERISSEYSILYNKYSELRMKKKHRSAEKKKEEKESRAKTQKEEPAGKESNERSKAREDKGKPSADEASRMVQEQKKKDQVRSETNFDESPLHDGRVDRPRSNTGNPTKFDKDKSPDRDRARGRSAKSREFEKIPENFQEASGSEKSEGGYHEEERRPKGLEDMLAYATNHIGMMLGTSFYEDDGSSKHDLESRVSTKKSAKSKERFPDEGKEKKAKKKKKKDKKDKKDKKEKKHKEGRTKKDNESNKEKDSEKDSPESIKGGLERIKDRPESGFSMKDNREETKGESEKYGRRSQESKADKEEFNKANDGFEKESSSSSESSSSEGSVSEHEDQTEEVSGSDDTPSSYYQKALGMEFPARERTQGTEHSLPTEESKDSPKPKVAQATTIVSNKKSGEPGDRPVSKGKTGPIINPGSRKLTEGDFGERVPTQHSRKISEGPGERLGDHRDDGPTLTENQQRVPLSDKPGISLEPSYQPRAETPNQRLPRNEDLSPVNKDRTGLSGEQSEEMSESEAWKRQRIFDLPESHEKFPFDSTKRPLSREYIKRDTVGSRSSSTDDKNATRNIFMNTFNKVMEGIQEEQKFEDKDRLPAFGETQYEFPKSRANKGLPADMIGVQGRSLKNALIPRTSMKSRGNASAEKQKNNTTMPVEEPDRFVEYRKTIREKLSKIQGVPPKQTKDPIYPQFSGPQGAQFTGQGISKTIQITKYKYGEGKI